MIITNRFNLPTAIYNVIANDNYKRGRSGYSVTEVINSPRIVHLTRHFADEIEEDAMDRIWSVFGSAVHHLMETHASDEGFTEERYYVNILDRVIGGQIDAYNNKTITDYKVTSVWSIIGNKRGDWEKQQNMYAYIMNQNGIPVEKIQIACFLRDWSKGQAQRGGDYPPLPFMVVPLRLWSVEEQEAYLYERVQELIINEPVASDPFYECSAEEMWEKPTTYAVTKEGSTRATKLCNSVSEAEEYILNSKVKNQSIIPRKGARLRCMDYCTCSKVCTLYQKYSAKGETTI